MVQAGKLEIVCGEAALVQLRAEDEDRVIASVKPFTRFKLREKVGAGSSEAGLGRLDLMPGRLDERVPLQGNPDSPGKGERFRFSRGGGQQAEDSQVDEDHRSDTRLPGHRFPPYGFL